MQRLLDDGGSKAGGIVPAISNSRGKPPDLSYRATDLQTMVLTAAMYDHHPPTWLGVVEACSNAEHGHTLGIRVASAAERKSVAVGLKSPRAAEKAALAAEKQLEAAERKLAAAEKKHLAATKKKEAANEKRAAVEQLKLGMSQDTRATSKASLAGFTPWASASAAGFSEPSAASVLSAVSNSMPAGPSVVYRRQLAPQEQPVSSTLNSASSCASSSAAVAGMFAISKGATSAAAAVGGTVRNPSGAISCVSSVQSAATQQPGSTFQPGGAKSAADVDAGAGQAARAYIMPAMSDAATRAGGVTQAGMGPRRQGNGNEARTRARMRPSRQADSKAARSSAEMGPSRQVDGLVAIRGPKLSKDASFKEDQPAMQPPAAPPAFGTFCHPNPPTQGGKATAPRTRQTTSSSQGSQATAPRSHPYPTPQTQGGQTAVPVSRPYPTPQAPPGQPTAPMPVSGPSTASNCATPAGKPGHAFELGHMMGLQCRCISGASWGPDERDTHACSVHGVRLVESKDLPAVGPAHVMRASKNARGTAESKNARVAGESKNAHMVGAGGHAYGHGHRPRPRPAADRVKALLGKSQAAPPAGVTAGASHGDAVAEAVRAADTFQGTLGAGTGGKVMAAGIAEENTAAQVGGGNVTAGVGWGIMAPWTSGGSMVTGENGVVLAAAPSGDVMPSGMLVSILRGQQGDPKQGKKQQAGPVAELVHNEKKDRVFHRLEPPSSMPFQDEALPLGTSAGPEDKDRFQDEGEIISLLLHPTTKAATAAARAAAAAGSATGTAAAAHADASDGSADTTTSPLAIHSTPVATMLQAPPPCTPGPAPPAIPDPTPATALSTPVIGNPTPVIPNSTPPTLNSAPAISNSIPDSTPCCPSDAAPLVPVPCRPATNTPAPVSAPTHIALAGHLPDAPNAPTAATTSPVLAEMLARASNTAPTAAASAKASNKTVAASAKAANSARTTAAAETGPKAPPPASGPSTVAPHTFALVTVPSATSSISAPSTPTPISYKPDPLLPTPSITSSLSISSSASLTSALSISHITSGTCSAAALPVSGDAVRAPSTTFSKEEAALEVSLTSISPLLLVGVTTSAPFVAASSDLKAKVLPAVIAGPLMQDMPSECIEPSTTHTTHCANGATSRTSCGILFTTAPTPGAASANGQVPTTMSTSAAATASAGSSAVTPATASPALQTAAGLAPSASVTSPWWHKATTAHAIPNTAATNPAAASPILQTPGPALSAIVASSTPAASVTSPPWSHKATTAMSPVITAAASTSAITATASITATRTTARTAACAPAPIMLPPYIPGTHTLSIPRMPPPSTPGTQTPSIPGTPSLSIPDTTPSTPTSFLGGSLRPVRFATSKTATCGHQPHTPTTMSQNTMALWYHQPASSGQAATQRQPTKLQSSLVAAKDAGTAATLADRAAQSTALVVAAAGAKLKVFSERVRGHTKGLRRVGEDGKYPGTPAPGEGRRAAARAGCVMEVPQKYTDAKGRQWLHRLQDYY